MPAPSHLPVALTSFVGRVRERGEVRRLLSAPRLLTLTGPGGCGKTRLALELAGEVASEWPDGVHLALLATLADSGLVPQTVATAVEVREEPGRELLLTLCDAFGSRRLLLILDNCEHLVTACARLAEALLKACPGVRILATSREALGIAGETAWAVPSLSLPSPDAAGGASTLLEYDAVRLFADRAADVLPGFRLTDAKAAAVAQICRRLDGIPLAIELAAARVKAVSLEQIAARLDDRFRLLSSGSRTALPRHQTLRALIDWSYDLLAEPERWLLRRLAVFAGGFTLEAAESVCSNDGLEREDILDLLSRLVDKSLVVTEADPDGPVRHRLLETIHQYAAEKLRAEDPLVQPGLRRRHARFFLAVAEEAEPQINSRHRQRWLARLESEHDNLRAALAWSLSGEGEAEEGLRLAGGLCWFWFHRGYWNEGRSWLERTLSPPVGADAKARALALYGAGTLAWFQGELDVARSRLEESARIWRQHADKRGLGRTLDFLSQVLVGLGDPEAGRALAEEAVALLRDAGDPWALGTALTALGNVARSQGDFTRARPLYEESAGVMRAAGDPWGLAMPLRNLGIVAFREGQYERAAAWLRESLASLRGLEEKWFASRGLESLAEVVAAQGDLARAARLFGAAETLRVPMGAPVLAWHHRPPRRPQGVAGRRAQSLAHGRDAPLVLHAVPDQALSFALGEASPTPAVGKGRPSAPAVAGTTEPPAELRVLGLGSAQLLRREEPVPASAWTYSKPRELLFYLLSHGGRTRDQIGEALWPERSSAQIRSSVSVALHHLRRALGRADWVVLDDDRYAFNRPLAFWYDVEAFEQRLDEARRLDPSEAARALETAVALYRGDFLEDLIEGDWYLARREELRRRYLGALLGLGQVRLSEGRHEDAAEACRRAIAHDSFFEAAHRELMRCYVRMGERAQALRHYQTLLERLREEIGSPPAPETTALYERLRRGEDPS